MGTINRSKWAQKHIRVASDPKPSGRRPRDRHCSRFRRRPRASGPAKGQAAPHATAAAYAVAHGDRENSRAGIERAGAASPRAPAPLLPLVEAWARKVPAACGAGQSGMFDAGTGTLQLGRIPESAVRMPAYYLPRTNHRAPGLLSWLPRSLPRRDHSGRGERPRQAYRPIPWRRRPGWWWQHVAKAARKTKQAAGTAAAGLR